MPFISPPSIRSDDPVVHFAPEETHAATPEEVLAIMDALEKAGEKKARVAVALMFFAGLRPGEARGVCWEDYDGKRLIIRQSVWHTYTTSTKTASSAKPVPVIEPLRSILADLRESERNPSTGPILRGPSGKPLDLHNLANRVVIPTLKKCVGCQLSESDHRKADHDFRLDGSISKWHGWYSLRRGVGTAVADLSNFSRCERTAAPFERQYNGTALHQGCARKRTQCNETAGNVVQRPCN